MYVCLCKGITDHQIKQAVVDGASNLRDVRKRLGVMTQCGKCGHDTKQIIEDVLFSNACAADDALYFAAG